MKYWYVYIILTDKGRLYTGISPDPERRFFEHLLDPKKGAKFFRSDAPMRFVYLEAFENRSLASQKEYLIKKLSRTQKESLIADSSNLCLLGE